MSRKCLTKGCRNEATKNRRYCNACRSRKYRRDNVLKATYANLRNNAKRRGKPFDISFEDYAKKAIETDYIKKKGRSSTSYTWDREDETKGYTKDNMGVIPNADNVRKYAKYKRLLKYHWNEEQRKMEYTTILVKPSEQGDGPF